jgi:hypothetical protein
MDSIFKIRDTKTGLFSTGGYCPSWTKTGKAWTSKQQIDAHLKLYCRGQYPGEAKKIPATWEIVELRMVEVSTTKARIK